MLAKVVYYPIAGVPLMIYFGIAALILFLAAALIPFLQSRAILNVPMKWHVRIASTALLLAFLHGLAALVF